MLEKPNLDGNFAHTPRQAKELTPELSRMHGVMTPEQRHEQYEQQQNEIRDVAFLLHERRVDRRYLEDAYEKELHMGLGDWKLQQRDWEISSNMMISPHKNILKEELIINYTEYHEKANEKRGIEEKTKKVAYDIWQSRSFRLTLGDEFEKLRRAHSTSKELAMTDWQTAQSMLASENSKELLENFYGEHEKLRLEVDRKQNSANSKLDSLPQAEIIFPAPKKDDV